MRSPKIMLTCFFPCCILGKTKSILWQISSPLMGKQTLLCYFGACRLILHLLRRIKRCKKNTFSVFRNRISICMPVMHNLTIKLSRSIKEQMASTHRYYITSHLILIAPNCKRHDNLLRNFQSCSIIKQLKMIRMRMLGSGQI